MLSRAFLNFLHMIKNILIILICFIGKACSSQSIEILYGMELYYGKHDLGREDLNVINLNNHDPFIKLRSSFTLLKNKKLGVILSYSSLRSHASLIVGTEDEVDSFDNFGNPLYLNANSSSTQLYRFGLGVSYKLYLWKDILLFNPKVILNNEFAKQTWEPSFGRSGEHGRYTYEYYAYSNPGFQILPEFVIPLNIKVYKGLSIQFEYAFLWGHRPSMYIEAIYKIDGVQQPNSRFYGDGTAHQAMMGLSYHF